MVFAGRSGARRRDAGAAPAGRRAADPGRHRADGLPGAEAGEGRCTDRNPLPRFTRDHGVTPCATRVCICLCPSNSPSSVNCSRVRDVLPGRNAGEVDHLQPCAVRRLELTELNSTSDCHACSLCLVSIEDCTGTVFCGPINRLPMHDEVTPTPTAVDRHGSCVGWVVMSQEVADRLTAAFTPPSSRAVDIFATAQARLCARRRV